LPGTDPTRAEPRPAGSAPRPPRTIAEASAFVAIYLALSLAWNLAGGSFRVWPDLWQLAPWTPLFEDLWGTLLDLHAQPPLLNLLFGLALRASAATGLSVEALLQPIYLAFGAATVAVTAALAASLVPRRGVRWAVLLLLVANPYLYAAHHYLFYTALELLFLALGALLALRYFERPTAWRLGAALLPPVLLVHTRSLFHPVWLVALAGLLLALGWPRRAVLGEVDLHGSAGEGAGPRPAAPSSWRAFAAVTVAAVIAVSFWPAKNLARFGFFGFSSWSGLSLARGVPTGEPLLPSGYPARLAAFARTADAPLDPAAAVAAQRLVPPELQDRPALVAVAKPDGSPNWNHYAMIPLSRELGSAALARLRQEPSLLFLKALDFYLNGYALYEARWPYRTGLSTEMTAGHAWANVYEAVVFQPFRAYDPAGTRLTNGFSLVFPTVVVAAAVALWRRRRAWGPAERTIAVLLLSIGWVLALVLFVDGPEGNRVRFCTEPYLFLVAGWLIGGGAWKVPPAGPSPERTR
jgi:hypothetical protein